MLRNGNLAVTVSSINTTHRRYLAIVAGPGESADIRTPSWCAIVGRRAPTGGSDRSASPRSRQRNERSPNVKPLEVLFRTKVRERLECEAESGTSDFPPLWERGPGVEGPFGYTALPMFPSLEKPAATHQIRHPHLSEQGGRPSPCAATKCNRQSVQYRDSARRLISRMGAERAAGGCTHPRAELRLFVHPITRENVLRFYFPSPVCLPILARLFLGEGLSRN